MSDETFASDAERELAVGRLREASAEGRLTLEELSARTDAAYAARTHGELVQVTAGLPALGAPRRRPRGAGAAGSPSGSSRPRGSICAGRVPTA